MILFSSIARSDLIHKLLISYIITSESAQEWLLPHCPGHNSAVLGRKEVTVTEINNYPWSILFQNPLTPSCSITSVIEVWIYLIKIIWMDMSNKEPGAGINCTSTWMHFLYYKLFKSKKQIRFCSLLFIQLQYDAWHIGNAWWICIKGIMHNTYFVICLTLILLFRNCSNAFLTSVH